MLNINTVEKTFQGALKTLSSAPVYMRVCVLIIIGLLLYTPGQSSLPVTDWDEARFAQASRQMVESHDFVDIRFHDGPRYQKPVGIYWLQSISAIASGYNDEAPLWVMRIPSLIGGILSLVFISYAGIPIIAKERAITAALLFSSTLIIAAETHIAKTDAFLLGLSIFMQAIIIRLYTAYFHPNTKYNLYTPFGHQSLHALIPWFFWAAFGFSILIKGPIAPLNIALSVIAIMIWQKKIEWLSPLTKPWPILISLAFTLYWFVAISYESDGAFWAASFGKDLIAKAVSAQEAKGLPPGFYIATLWVTFWPASVFLILAIPALWRNRHNHVVVLLLCLILPNWLMYELLPTKLLHYTMPAYPMLSLLIVYLVSLSYQKIGTLSKAFASIALLLGFIFVGLLIYLAFISSAPMSALKTLFIGLIFGVFFGAIALGAIWRQKITLLLVAIFLTGATLNNTMILGLSKIPVLWPSQRIIDAIKSQAQTSSCTNTSILSFGYTEPSLVWLAGHENIDFLTQELNDLSKLTPCQFYIYGKKIAAPDWLSHANAPPPPQVFSTQPFAHIQSFAIGSGSWFDLSVFSPLQHAQITR